MFRRLPVVVVSIFATSVWGQSFSATLLHPAGAESSAVWAVDSVQQGGEAVFAGEPHAARWTGTPASFVDLNPAGSPLSRVRAIAAGIQIGTATTPEGGSRAHIWAGSAASASSLHPAGAIHSACLGAAPGQQVGGADGRAAIWFGDAASFTVIHPDDGAGASIAMASDGNQQGGEARYGGVPHAALWAGSSESYIDLNPAGATSSGVRGLADGQQVGWATIGGQRRAAMWAGASATYRTLHPAGFDHSEAAATTGVSQVGFVAIDTSIHRAALWQGRADRWINLHVLLPGGYRSSQATSVVQTGDELRIGGFAVTTGGRREAVLWRAPAPVLCYADCNTDAQLDFFDFLCFQNMFATGVTDADCDASGALDFFDFLCFQNAFGAGCP